MTKPTTAETVITNIRMLLDASMMKVPALSKKSGVPASTIYCILNRTRVPGVDTTDQIAQAFGLSGWHMLMPNLKYDLIKSGKLDRLIIDYAHCPEPARDYINMVAERDAEYPVEKNGTQQ